MAVVHAVVGDATEAAAKVLELLEPGFGARTVAVEEDERLSGSLLDIIDVNPVHIDPRHGATPSCELWGNLTPPWDGRRESGTAGGCASSTAGCRALNLFGAGLVHLVHACDENAWPRE